MEGSYSQNTHEDHAANAGIRVSYQKTEDHLGGWEDILSQRMSEINRKIASPRGVEFTRLTVGMTSE